jgi:hypothetical protein
MIKCAKLDIDTRPLSHQKLRPPRVPRHQSAAIALLSFAVAAALSVGPAHAGPSQARVGADRWEDLGDGVLRDRRTNLQWLKDDNGEDVDWHGATSFCDRRHDRWRLPRLEELKSIYDPGEPGVRCAHAECKVAPLFRLTGTWFWSATQVGKDGSDGIELAWGVQLSNGVPTQAVRDAGYGSRALCVRGT